MVSQRSTLHKKLSFPFRISLVNVSKFPADLVTITEEIFNRKLYFSLQYIENEKGFRNKRQLY